MENLFIVYNINQSVGILDLEKYGIQHLCFLVYSTGSGHLIKTFKVGFSPFH